jgi:hypothetical protein
VGGLRKALIVANDVYEHQGLKHLLAPMADAEALARVLGDSQIGDFEVHVVRNEPAHVIGGQIEDLFADGRSEDVLLLHFSCHGLKSESGELFFAARDTRPSRLGSTAISADFVQRCMRASRSRSIVLLLDCCYGGAFSQGVTVRAAGDVNVLDSFPGGRLGGGRGRAVITASSAMEYAFEGDQLADDHSRRPSVFTSALVEGLATGDADRDQDGWVSLNELYDYVFDRVREQNPQQTPSRDVEMQGELYLARRSRPVTTPAPLPSELQEVIDHPLAGIRAGAAQELARLTRGRHAGLALAARLALERLTADDSRTVAAAAAAALVAVGPDRGSAPIGVPAPADPGPTPAPGQKPAAEEARTISRAEDLPQSQGYAWGEAQGDVASAEDSPAARQTLGQIAGDLPAVAADAQALVQPRPSQSGATRDGAAREDVPPALDSPALAPVDITSPARSTDPAEDTPTVEGPTRLARPEQLRRRRLVYAAVVALVLAAASTSASLLILDRNGSPGDGGRSATNEFTAPRLWRLVVSNRIELGDKSCTVTVTNSNTGEEKVFENISGNRSFQMQNAGKFRWEVNDPGCVVLQQSGTGTAKLSFSHKAGTGDTPAFTAPKPPGKVVVQVRAFNSYGRCSFDLHDAADGLLLDGGTIYQGGAPLGLNPQGRRQVYVAAFEGCDVVLSAG